MMRFFWKIWMPLAILSCFCQESVAQNQFHLVLKKENSDLLKDFFQQKSFEDSLQIYQYLKDQLNLLRSASFLEASIDEISCNDSICKASLYLGPEYKIAEIRTGNITGDFLSESGFRSTNFSNTSLKPESVSLLLNDVLTAYENNGYPFAVAFLKNVRIADGTLNAELHVDKKKRFLYDRPNLIGEAEISIQYIQNYLGVKEGEAYDQSQILKIRDILNSNRFLSLKENPTITFKANKAILNLNLANKKASRFDFLIGILPQTTGNETSFTITGEVTADLYNKLGRGEHFFLEFKRLRAETQELKLAFNYPYLLDLPFGIDTEFELFRNSSDFLEVDFNAGVQYLFSGVNYMKVFFDFNSIRLLEVDTASIKVQGVLPAELDLNYNSGGIAFNFENLDYKFNPRKGYHWQVSAAVGFKSIVRNNQILAIESDDVDFNSLYDSLKQRTHQFDFTTDFSYFFPLQKRATVLARARAGYKVGGESVFENELYRIGGYNLLRGFDEESVLAQFFSVFSLEYRLLISQNSYLSAFLDYGITKNEFRINNVWDRPFGFGAGLNFETSAGLFGLSAAVGSQLSNPINFRDIKVHFGYVSLF